MSQQSDYFNVYDISCEEQRLKVRFTQDVPWSKLLSFTDETNPLETIVPRGTVLQLPLWMARALHQAGVAVILPPRQFSGKVRADLAAGAESVNLRDLSPYWYSLGLKVAQLLPTENISRVLRAALGGRLEFMGRAIFASNLGMAEGGEGSSGGDPHKTIFGRQGATAILDHMEQTIYMATVATRKDTDNWSNRSMTR